MKPCSQPLFALVLLLTVPPILAQGTGKDETPWIYITTNSERTDKYSAKKGSFEITKNKSGIDIAVVLGQTQNKNVNQINYNKWYVSTSDCDKGMGKLVVLKVNGDYDFESDFVADGNNIASGIADFICSVYKFDKNQKQGKGI